MKETFFLKDIKREGYRNSLSDQENAALDLYLQDMQQGPADGEMDIEWQESGRGYYAHLHQLESLDDAQKKTEYLKRLKEDINLWLADESNNYMVNNVNKILFGKKSDM